MTSFVQYKKTNALGSTLAKSIDSMNRATGYLAQFNARFERMDEEFATSYLQLDDYDAFVKAIKNLNEAMSDSKLVDAIFALD